MRRITTLALTAALVIGGAPAVLAQPHGSPQTGQEASQQGRDRATERSGLDVPVGEQARQDGRGFGQQRAEDARQHADPQGSSQTGQEASQEGRDRAAEHSGLQVPASEQAREDGRAFGEQRAEQARQRADEGDGVEEPTDESQENEESDTEGPDDVTDMDDVDLTDVDDVDLTEVPDEAQQARGVLAGLGDALHGAFEALKDLFGFGTDTA